MTTPIIITDETGRPFIHHIDRIDPFKHPVVELIKKRVQTKYVCERSTLSSYYVDMFGEIIHTLNNRGPVLITGETGTGKELIAKTIHENSDRKKNNLVTVDCAMIPNDLLYSELFGHIKGAFTGATSETTGLIQEANGGTLFLDEIGDLPPNAQCGLLRVLEYGTYRKLGQAKEEKKVDVRIISATNKLLPDNNILRDDLYYRLDMFHIHIPPLRNRVNDIPFLMNEFLSELESQYKTEIKGIDPIIFILCSLDPLPGNVRQLKNEINAAFYSGMSIMGTPPAYLSVTGWPETYDHLIKALVDTKKGGNIINNNDLFRCKNAWIKPPDDDIFIKMVCQRRKRFNKYIDRDKLVSVDLKYLRDSVLHFAQKMDLLPADKKAAIDLFAIDSFKKAKQEFEKQYLTKKLEENARNIPRTARRIGMKAFGLRKALKRLGM
ncbi:MAG: sigma 54-interacting transcriptional regulator [candidate division Zixibacteria bacterium]|nr:sigma 54-interacting transcriptional regulator [candidate division Zixibacteria bacterium]